MLISQLIKVGMNKYSPIILLTLLFSISFFSCKKTVIPPDGMGVDYWSQAEFYILILTVFIIGRLIYWFANKVLLHKKQQLLKKDLHPFYTDFEIHKATQFYIQTRYQDTAPSEAEELGQYINSPTAPLIKMMLTKAFKQAGNRFYLILADSGMGKTTFILNLYLAYINQWSWKKKYDIKLFPLGHEKTFKEISKIKDPKQTILLLDAFDEDNQAVENYRSRLKEILDIVEDFRKVVITCRTQFFPSAEEEPYKTGFVKFGADGGEHTFRKEYVSVFEEKDIDKYLRRRFKFHELKKRKKAKEIVAANISVMVRPMLLSHIEDLVKEDKKYNYRFQIYETLIEKWIEREATKPGIIKIYGSKEDFKSKLYVFSHDFARYINNTRNNRGGNLSLHKDTKIDSKSGLQLVDLFEAENNLSNSEWRNRSLLNRDSQGNYKFSHKSILEYFIAIDILSNNFEYNLHPIKGMEMAKLFCQEISHYRFFRDESKSNSRIFDFINLSKKNLTEYNFKSFSFKWGNLEETNIEGVDLEGANLQGTNLKNAILERTNLQVANLKGATLEGANLQGANLKNATLEGANLQGANLKNATLEGANLQGANLKNAALEGS